MATNNNVVKTNMVNNFLNLLLDFSNLLLTEDQLFNDNYLSLILTLNNNGANLIKVSNLAVKELLMKKYPYYTTKDI